MTLRKYRKITLQDRLQIEKSLKNGESTHDIGRLLGFQDSTISREIRRERKRQNGAYDAHTAEENHKISHQRKPPVYHSSVHSLETDESLIKRIHSIEVQLEVIFEIIKEMK